ncbi:DNA repair protein HhH-GPD [Luteitalea sp. TBR-22]|uniref:SulP family inorganic anion transporter n=1 Tax=Luteitalea sp. TBR-22 TaxID=2802971 RepID=UPI001AF30DA4|nr:SulP family inorganic anion transporter [Luteitalea sp. TBR-22]BCS31210.1 DNA repair protein HhH-GPD [Luteitalea sp. TBR-22]
MDVTTLVPSLAWLPRYRREWVRPDLMAGLTAAAVVVPKAMAYATIAQLPLQVGLYTAIVPMVVYALLGASRPLSVSTTTTIAILTAAELGRAAPGGDAAMIAAAATLSVLVGLLLGLAALLRLGFVANFISDPVLTGFKSGIGLVIVVDQLPKLLGVHFAKTGFFRDLVALAGQLPETSLPTLLLALGLLLVLVVLEHVAPRAPAALVAIGIAIAVSGLLGLEQMGVATVGAVSGGLPTLLPPQFALAWSMWPAAAGIALMSFTESIAAARAFGAPGEGRPEPNQELFALGVANVAGGLFGAMPSGGGTSQTAVNRLAGARTQVAGLVTAAAALATLLLLGPVIALMPQAALAAVVVFYSLELIKPAEFAAIGRVRRTEFYWAAIACAGVMLLGTLRGILVAVVVSLVSLAQQAYNPPVHVLGRKRGTSAFRTLSPEHPDDETWPGLLILRPEGRLFFANAERVADRIRPMLDRQRPRVLLLDCRAIIDIEYTALRMLIDAEERLRSEGTSLWLAGLNPEVLEVVRRSALGERLGRERMFFNLDAAIHAFEARHVA